MKTMNLYLISQHVNTDYDTYSGAVVAAPDAVIARNTHPAAKAGEDPWNDPYSRREWISPKYVKVELLGKAKPGTKQGVILASFRAG